MNRGEGGGHCKLAARFVRDVTVFDGTQMAPGTRFTKIWRLKNGGEMPWPAGTKMLFVGGDQMTTEMSVPLSRDTPVQPGEEVDVAVEMKAPDEMGRFLGYWRLTGPHGRRKFGQRVWCHIQVVDPSQPPAPPTEIEIKNAMAARAEAGDDDDDDDDDGDGDGINGGAADGAADAAADGAAGAAGAADGATMEVDGATAAAGPATKEVAAELAAMGFAEEELVAQVMEKHGADLEACARDLAALTEWDAMLDDLAEMGFTDRALNKRLMIKHDGSLKRTVKDLVTDA